MMTAPIAAPKNIATTDSTLLANLGLLPFAIEEIGKMRDKLDAMLTNLLKVKPGCAVR